MVTTGEFKPVCYHVTLTVKGPSLVPLPMIWY